MRLIDADRLKAVFDKNIGNPYAKGVFRQYVDMQPTISQWISVSERLPNDGELVMTSDKSPNISCYIVGSESWCIDIDNKRIIAWMPLPEPYKESDD